MAEQIYKSHINLTKSKYKEFDKNLKTLVTPELYSKIMCTFKESFKFDIDACSSNPETIEKTKQYRHKLREEQGISTYISSGAKKAYEKKKLLQLSESSNEAK